MTNLMHKFLEQMAKESRKRYREQRKKERREYLKEYEHVYYAHEICQCKHKFYLEHKFPELTRDVALKENVVIGNVVEKGVKTYMLGLWGSQPPYKKAIGGTLILGHPDFYDEEEDTIIDTKFKAHRPFKPQHHVFRMKLYNFLADKDRCSLLYFSPEGLKEKVVTDSLSVERLKEHFKSTWTSPMWEDWECEWCPFEHICSESNQG